MAVPDAPAPARALAPDPLPSPHGAARAGDGPGAAPRAAWGAGLFIAALAALLASSPARHGDLWKHLVAGRQLLTGPPTGATALPLPDGPGWLFDLGCYVLYDVLGGAGLVAGKVGLVVALGLVLLRLCRPGPRRGVAAACTALALVAMSLYLPVAPVTASYLLLALSLLCLRATEDARLPRFVGWLLPVVFVLWAQVDRAFVLGLAVIALDGLGAALDGVRAPRRGACSGRERLALALVTGVVLATVLLLNRPLLRAFTLPPELGGAGAFSSSPFQPAYLAGPGRSPAGLAYVALLGLGAASFLVNRAGWSWQRFLPWLALAALSVCSVRAVAFFAVLGGPALAWNLRELGVESGPARRSGRVLGLAAALIVLLAAWPGWLQGPPFEPRRWAFTPAPAPQHAAAAIEGWRQQALLPPGAVGLHLTPETAYALAWRCPDADILLDDGLAAALRQGAEDPAARAARLRAARVDHVVVYDPDRARLLTFLEQVARTPHEWPLLHLEGDLAVFGWRDPARSGGDASDPFRGRELDLGRRAFHPPADPQVPRGGPAARSRPWWASLWAPAPPRSIDHDSAAFYLLYADALHRSAPYRRLATWEAGGAAALVAAAGHWGRTDGPVDAGMRLLFWRPPLPAAGPIPPLSGLALSYQQACAAEQDDVPPAVLYLAIRSARRALAADPDDGQAYLVLGESYLRLLSHTRERVWGRRLPELVQLRRTQASAALNRAVALRPDLAQAHGSLARLYQEIGYFDLALAHGRAYHERTRAAGDTEAQAAGEEGLRRMADGVAGLEAEYAAAAEHLTLMDRALWAYRKGLAGKAREVLLDSDVAAFGPRGLRLELELLLRTGRTTEVIEWTDPAQKAAMGAATYHWLRVQALAAAGAYVRAEEECDLLAAEARGRQASPPAELLTLLVGQAILDESPALAGAPERAWRSVGRLKFANRVLALAKDLRQVANANVFRGLLALERGNADDAETAFRLALAMWQDEAAVARGAGLEFNARPVAQAALQWLQ